MSTYEAVSFQTQQGVAVDLRMIPPEDACHLQQLLSHPEVQAHIQIRTGAGSDLAQVEKLVNRMLFAFDPCALHAGIYLKEQQKLIGIVALQHWNRREGKATLGYMLDPAYWGGGLATEAVGLFLNYSVHTLGITRIEGRCRGDNIRSERVMLKNGMMLERVMPRVGSLDDVMKVFTLLHK
ncbi:GNAT family N-acetyltransferase [Paenibacillus sp. FSL H7-0737]|uniref:GNAT family N-acetyltransferase n=1 Tax=unclassified Paenibacillus TaxID=185978 RepID=UPI0006939D2F|nr:MULTISPECIES: GNAT family N-acetyltransferase [unclassified Paenibacillus]KAA1187722.1 GNAT family N-acetyltransferase [Paenibacillus sp. B2(2019)]